MGGQEAGEFSPGLSLSEGHFPWPTMHAYLCYLYQLSVPYSYTLTHLLTHPLTLSLSLTDSLTLFTLSFSHSYCTCLPSFSFDLYSSRWLMLKSLFHVEPCPRVATVLLSVCVHICVYVFVFVCVLGGVYLCVYSTVASSLLIFPWKRICLLGGPYPGRISIPLGMWTRSTRPVPLLGNTAPLHSRVWDKGSGFLLLMECSVKIKR